MRVTHKVISVITEGFIDQLSLHISVCQEKGGTLQLKDSNRELKRKGRINASLETCSDVYSGVQEKGYEPIENMSNGIQSWGSGARCQRRT